MITARKAYNNIEKGKGGMNSDWNLLNSIRGGIGSPSLMNHLEITLE